MKMKKKIKVTVHLPEKVSEVIRQQKINRIYNLLKPNGKKTA
jgi:hypothetical protein